MGRGVSSLLGPALPTLKGPGHRSSPGGFGGGVGRKGLREEEPSRPSSRWLPSLTPVLQRLSK